MNKRLAAAAVTALMLPTLLTACGGDRWCEEDATDRKVSDRYCENNTPGYEWEPDSDGKKHKKPKKTKRPPAADDADAPATTQQRNKTRLRKR